MRRVLQAVVLCLVLALTVAFIGGFLGAFYPLGDSLAVFRIPIAVLLALVVIWTNWPFGIRWFITLLCVAAIAQIIAQRYTTHPPGPVGIYQKNLRFGNPAGIDLQNDIRAVNADIVTLQEITSVNAHLLRSLQDLYPHQKSCALSPQVRIAVLSRWPYTGSFCSAGHSVMGIYVQSPDGPFWAVSLHLTWPFPFVQAQQVRWVAAQLRALNAPIVLGDDFNMVPWSHTLRLMQVATGSQRAGPLLRTWQRSGVPLPIDHVLAPGGGDAQRRPLLGSDHHGVAAQVFVH